MKRLALSGLAALLAVCLLIGALGVVTAGSSFAGRDLTAAAEPAADPLPRSLTAESPSSPLSIVKTADVSSAAFGDEVEFTLYVHNQVDHRVPTLVFDPIADGVRYVRDSFRAEPPGTTEGYDEHTNAIYWQGDVEGGATVTIRYRVRVVRCDPHGFQVTNVAVAYAYGQGQLPASSAATVDIEPCKGRDLGDAPDSTNHFATDMSAYPGVAARFPTVFDHDTGVPPGPLHRNPSAVHLGRGVSFERDADVPPDQDGFTNLLPIPHAEVDVADVATLGGIANLDGFDDGLRPPEVPPCGVWEELPVVITVNDPTIPQQDGLLYLNIWVDGNHNGRWGDVGVCENGAEGFEWVLQDFEIPMGSLVTGTQVVTVPRTLPVLREPSSDGGVLPAWMRVTLSESPAPHASVVQPTGIGELQTDGRGPQAGWELGETEDYYLPGTSRPPVAIDKTADKEIAALGDEIEFTITLTNPTAEPAKVLMYDPIPDGTEYISDTFTSSVPGILEGYNEALNAVLWQGFVPGNGVVVITFRVQVVRCHPEGSAVLNTAWAYDYEVKRATAASVRVRIEPCVGPDLGDAPDSTNHFLNTPMTAYPAVRAEFPTVFDAATGAPPGPLHHNAYAVHLGERVSFERDADQPPDQDGVPNLRPRHDEANLDRYDDAFPQGLPQIASCEAWENLPVAITVNDSSLLQPDSPLYLNIWVDGTHDGDWTDTNLCGDSSEWVLQNYGISTGSLAAGINVIHVTTLPVFRSESNDLRLPAWLRITLSESPVPVPIAPDIPDGSGPSEGWELGETEDHYLPGDPAISIDKVADKNVAASGDEIEFTVTLSNGSGDPARVTMYDLIPPGTEYVPNSYINVSGVPAIEEGYDVGTPPSFGVTRHWITWRGDVPANGTVVIKFRVRVVRCDPEGFRVINDAWAFEPGLPPVSATAVVEIEPCRKGDVGDAPDSSNHFPGTTMTAYAGVEAHFPTVFDDPTGDPPGPMHWRREAHTRLGVGVSSERDADLLPDDDGRTNLDPPADEANRDQYDDGLIRPAISPFPHCQPTEISVVVTVAPGTSGAETPIRERYINAWFDWNRDGDWEDAFDCDTGDGIRAASLEWAVRDYLVRLGPGTHVVSLPAFLPFNEQAEQDLWARITLSEEPAPVNETTGLADGRGPEDGYRDGETEDYLIPGRPDVVLHKAVDKEHVRLGAQLTYTLTLQNGSDTPVAGVHVEDPIPAGTSFVGGSLWSSKPEAGFTGTAVTWDGDLEAGETVTIGFKVQVAVASSVDAAGNALLLCARVVRNRAELTLPNGETSSSNVVATFIRCPDLGDAPDSSNHVGVDMTAYGTVTATFPTVYDAATGTPPGPIHWEPLARAWLGYRVSGERDADLMPDEDGRPNLDPVNDSANRDRHDDGLVSLTSVARFPHCEETTVRVLVSVAGPSPTDPDLEPIRELYINAWFDWNRDGDWEDAFDCEGADLAVLEWAVRDYRIALPPGLHEVTLPAFLPYNPTPDQDLWARFTLSEGPAPVNEVTGLADGRGPDDGYRFGETEDYRFPGQPTVGIRKAVDKERASLGDELTYTLTVHNSGSAPLVGVHVEDPIPAGTSFVNGSLWASKPVTGFTGSAVTWDGDVNPGETVTIGFKVKIGLASTDDVTHIELECEGAVRNHAVLLLPDGVSLSSNVVATRILCPDLGDAPDSSNHFNVRMTAYGTVTATFPTVFRSTSDPAIEPPGPIHWQPRRLAWFGYRVSGERDADLMPDEDGRPNLDPVNDSANRDRHDDGLVSLTSAAGFPHCEPTTVRVLVNVAGPSATDSYTELIRELYINAWFDWNRDGDWEDAFDCEGVDLAAALEWAVRDYKIALPPGLHEVALPAFLPYNPTPDQNLWARFTLSEEPAPVNEVTGLADGRGPDDGYKYGETEDYLIPGRPAVDIHKVVDLRHVGLGEALTYTLTVHNGGNALVTGVEVKDAIPEGTSYISGTLQSSKPTSYYENGAVYWTGDVEANETVTISFQVRVAALDPTLVTTDLKCERVIRNYAVLALPSGISYTSNVVLTEVLCPDLGDAPDSTNHFNVRMSAYGVVTATFPTVFDAATGAPPGPLHWRPRADAYLGYWVSGERDADLMPDEDGRPNLKPPHDDANLDRADDGLVEPVRLPHCEQTKIKVRVNWPGPVATADATIERYINVWFDWNRDGDWEDAFDCADQLLGVLEWVVRDYLVTLQPGVHEVELPAFLPYNPTPYRPIWARVTLAEQPAPVNPDTGLPDGRGPDAGYKYGETEDYLIPGIHVEPEVKIVKRVNKLHAGLGEELEYTILVENGGPDPVAGAHVEDEIPDGTTYVPDSLWASKPVTGFTGSAVTWDGDIDPGETVTISFKVQVKAEPDLEAVNDERCGRSIRNRAVLVLPVISSDDIAPDGITVVSNEVHTRIVCPDLGDAPDSSNHHGVGMTTYPGNVPAHFPTVFDPATGLPQGPKHLLSTQDAWLGPRDAPPTGERDADLMPDEDGRPNIYPPDNKADQDEHDNGVFRDSLNLQHCEPATFKYQVTIVGPQRERFVNVWFDWNRDGDWEDVLDCPDAPAPEWAVHNQVISLGPGTYVLTTKTFLPWRPDPDDPMWMRITLAERPVGPALATAAGDVIPNDGSGPAAGYRYGETEDYLLGHIDDPNDPPDVWVQKELRTVDFDDAAVDLAGNAPARFFFHIEYGNSGGSTAADVVIADTLPISTTYKGSHSVPDIEPPTVVTPTVSWNAGALNPGDHGFIDVWFHVPAHLFEVLPPGTVLTNTATITTTTPGDDPSNNTAIITATIPLLPPRITWPIPGTTCGGEITVTGKSQIGTFVDLYVNGVYTATTTVDGSGNWDVPLTLPDGTHSIYAKARTVLGDESAPSPTVVVVVDSTLAWDPMSMTFSTSAPDGFVWTQHIRTEDGRADPDGWSVFLPTRITETQQYTVTVLACCSSPTVTLTVSNTVYAMTATGNGWYQTVIDAPGDPTAPITLTVECDGVTSSGSGSGLIDPDGYVFDVDVGKATGKLSGKTVTALEYDSETSSWDRWPAELYESQTNPQVTGADGYYSFYTPPGDYQITVDASADYQGYRSWTLTVISTPVHLDIPLTPVYGGTQYAVTVDAAGFVPDTLEVVQGSVVQWKNNEATAGVWHSATSDVDARTDTRGWDSGLLDSGETYSRRFDTLGTFTYYDHENPALVGTIKVCYLYDFDCDSKVGASDLQAVAAQWRTVSGTGGGYDSRYDVDGNGRINIIDIQLSAADWGWTMPSQ